MSKVNPVGRRKVSANEQDLSELVGATWSALEKTNRPPKLFARDGRIVRIETRDPDELVIRELSIDAINLHLAREIEFYKEGKDGEEHPARPPSDLARSIRATPNPPLPQLRSIVRVPIYASDGTLISEPGYHESSGTMYRPRTGFKLPDIPEDPNATQVTRAKELIESSLLGDFPFKGDSDRTHAVAALLQPFVRDLITGPTPLHLIWKPTPGTGGTLLAQVLAYPALGRIVSGCTCPQDESEWKRTFLSLLRESPSVTLIDNVDRKLESPTLASVLTADRYDDRVVGTSEMLSAAVRCLWIATGNNPQLSREIARRAVGIRLDAGVEKPDLRSRFRHPNLKQWTARNHGRLVWAALTIVQAWVSAGRPPGKEPLGMFEFWAAVIGGILETAGFSGFLANLDDMRNNADTETVSWLSFTQKWWSKSSEKEVRAKDLLPLADDLDLGNGVARSRLTRLGKQLAAHRDQRYGSYCIRKGGFISGSQTWRLEAVDAK